MPHLRAVERKACARVVNQHRRAGERGGSLESAGPAKAGHIQVLQIVGVAGGIEIPDIEHRDMHGSDSRCKQPGQGRVARGDQRRAGMRAYGGDDIGDALAGGGAVVCLEMFDLRRGRRVERRERNRLRQRIRLCAALTRARGQQPRARTVAARAVLEAGGAVAGEAPNPSACARARPMHLSAAGCDLAV